MFKDFSLLLYSLVQQSHNYNDFSVRVLRVVSLMEEKGDKLPSSQNNN